MESNKSFEDNESVSNDPPVADSVVDQVQNNATSTESVSSPDSWEEHKLVAIIGYVFPILFFIPLINETSKSSTYARFHAGQQLNLLLAGLFLYIAGNFLMSIMFALGMGFIILAIFNLIPLLLLVFAVIGIIGANKGEMKELPIIGNFRLLK